MYQVRGQDISNITFVEGEKGIIVIDPLVTPPAAKAALDYKKNWAFINVLDDIEPKDNCRGAKNLGKIGIIASSDIVALEQCTLDFVIEKVDADSSAKSEWKAAHCVGMVEKLEKLGGGTRNYRLVEVK